MINVRATEFSPEKVINATKILFNKQRRDDATRTTPSVMPGKAGISKMEISVKMKIQIIELQTSGILVTWDTEGSASDKPSINLSQWETFGDFKKDGTKFTQTITGRAIDEAFMKIEPKLNEFFKKNL